jgi:hypothetical protein
MFDSLCCYFSIILAVLFQYLLKSFSFRRKMCKYKEQVDIYSKQRFGHPE